MHVGRESGVSQDIMLKGRKSRCGKKKKKIEQNYLYSICNGELGFRGGSVVKNQPARQEPWVQTLGWEDPLEKEMATQSSLLAWGIP